MVVIAAIACDRLRPVSTVGWRRGCIGGWSVPAMGREDARDIVAMGTSRALRTPTNADITPLFVLRTIIP